MPELWEPQEIFAGQTVYILGGGSSVNEESRLDEVPGERLMVVNWGIERRPDAAFCLFRDSTFRDQAIEHLRAFKGALVTRAEGSGPTREALRGRPIRFWADVDGNLSTRKGYLCGSNSGHNALNLFLQMGPSRIALIGFDGGSIDGTTFNYHRRYEKEAELGHSFYPGRWIPDMIHLAQSAARLYPNTEIINCSLKSHIISFKKRPLAEVLDEDPLCAEDGRGVQAESRTPAA